MPKFLDYDNPFEALASEKIEADAKIQPWQLDLTKDDCFFYFSHKDGIVVWAEILEKQVDPVFHGYRFCRRFSVKEPAGVEGYVHVSVVHKQVDRQTFEKAKSEGWPHDEPTFTRFAALLQREKTAH